MEVNSLGERPEEWRAAFGAGAAWFAEVAAHAVPGGFPHVALEIRQDLIDTAAGARHWAELLAQAFEPILAAPELYRAERS